MAIRIKGWTRTVLVMLAIAALVAAMTGCNDRSAPVPSPTPYDRQQNQQPVPAWTEPDVISERCYPVEVNGGWSLKCTGLSWADGMSLKCWDTTGPVAYECLEGGAPRCPTWVSRACWWVDQENGDVWYRP